MDRVDACHIICTRSCFRILYVNVCHLFFFSQVLGIFFQARPRMEAGCKDGQAVPRAGYCGFGLKCIIVFVLLFMAASFMGGFMFGIAKRRKANIIHGDEYSLLCSPEADHKNDASNREESYKDTDEKWKELTHSLMSHLARQSHPPRQPMTK